MKDIKIDSANKAPDEVRSGLMGDLCRLGAALRLRSALLILAVLEIFPATGADAQQDAYRGWEKMIDTAYVRNPDRQALRGFRISEPWEAERKLEKAKERLQAGEFTRAVDFLHQVVMDHAHDVLQVGVDSFQGAKGCARFAGAAELAHYLLATLPDEGKGIYDVFAREKAGKGLERAKAEGDLETLKGIGETYAASATGKEAFRYLAEHYLEEGEYELAAIYFKKILLFHPDGDAAVWARLIQTLDHLGREEEKAGFLQAAPAGGAYTDPDGRFRRDLEENAALVSGADSDWTTVGGDNTRSRPMPLLVDPASYGSQWSAVFLNDRLARFDPFARREQDTGSVPARLLRSGDYLITNDSISAVAFNLYTGEPFWHFRGPLERLEDPREYYDLEDYLSYRRFRSSSTISPQLIAGGTVARGRVYLNLQARRKRQTSRMLSSRVINRAIPRRGLFALNLADGRLIWGQGDQALSEDDFLGRVSIPSPPVVLGDRVICNAYLREGGIQAYVLCFDGETGKLVWRASTGIGQQELTMFNMEYKEFHSTPISEVEGTLIFCSNLGFICGLEAMSGRIRWITEYETIPLPPANRFGRPPEPRRVYWENNPPVVAGDVVVVTPLDAREIIALDWRTGRTRWKLPAQKLGVDQYRNMLGTYEDKVVLSGMGGAAALSADRGSRVWRVTLPPERSATGRGAMTRDRLYLPVEGTLFTYDLSSGKALGKIEMGFTGETTNLFLMGEVVAVVSSERIEMFFNASRMLAQAEARCGEDGGTFGDLVFLGDMYRLSVEYGKAATSYRKALERGRRDPGILADRIAKVEKSLYDTYRDLGGHRREWGQHQEAEEAYRSAMKVSGDPDRFMAVALDLLDHFAALENGPSALGLLSELEEQCGAHRYGFGGREELEEAPVGLFVLAVRHRLARDRGDYTEEVKNLQAMIEGYPGEEIQGIHAREWASGRLDELIREHGREIYAAFDRRAESALETALAEGNVAQLERIQDRYPNARVSGRVALEIARLYLDRDNAASAYQALTDYLGGRGNAAELPHALYLMARAAALEGNPALSNALHRRILTRFPDVEVPWKPGETYGSLQVLAEAEDPLEARPPLLPQGEYRVGKYQLKSRQCWLLPTEGKPPAFMEGKVLLELENLRELVLFDYRLMEPVWTRDLRQFRTAQNEEILSKVIHVQGMLVVLFETLAVGIDLETGALRWQRNTDGVLLDGTYLQGLLGLLCEASEEQGDEERILLLTVNPITGGILWQKAVPVSSHAKLAPSEDVFCVISAASRWDSILLFFDPLTGIEWRRIRFPEGRLMPFAFPSTGGRLLVTEDREVAGTRRNERYKIFHAFDARDGERLWSLPLDAWRVNLGDCVRSGERLIMMATERSADRERKSLIQMDLASGQIVAKKAFTGYPQPLVEVPVLPDKLLFTRSGREREQLFLSGFDVDAMEFRFEDRRFPLGNDDTQYAILGNVAYASDGVVIPLDFVLRRSGDKPLCSQVLLVDGREGRLLYTLDLFWEGRGRLTSIFQRSFPVEVAVRDGVVLVLKSSDLYVIQGSRAGG